MLDIEPAQEPLPDKEWHQHLEGLLNIGELNPDIVPYLSSYQMYCVNEIKKTFKRIKYREKNEDD
jgi:hypothetical protein